MTDDTTAQDIDEGQDTPDAATETGDAEPQQSATEDSSGETDLDYWKRRARENEERAKSNHKELEKLRRDSMSEQERAIAEARDAGRSEALREASGRVVDAEIRSASVGRPINVDTLLAGLDRSQFLDDSGDVDRDAVTGWLDSLAPVQQQPQQVGDMAQGVRSVNRSSPDEVFGELIASSLR